MQKNSQNLEVQISKIIAFAEHVRRKIIIPSLQLQNYLNFQYSQLAERNPLSFCTIERANVNKSFQRAFKRMHKYEQATYYSKYLKFIIEQMNYLKDQANQQKKKSQKQTKQGTKFEKMVILTKKQGSFKKWTLTKIQIACQICVIRIIDTGQQLDLNNYLMRYSKSKNKTSLVLQSTQNLNRIRTIRVSNYSDTFEQLKIKLSYYIQKALRYRISRLLTRNRSSASTQLRKSILQQIIPFQLKSSQQNYYQDNHQVESKRISLKTVNKQDFSQDRLESENSQESSQNQRDYNWDDHYTKTNLFSYQSDRETEFYSIVDYQQKQIQHIQSSILINQSSILMNQQSILINQSSNQLTQQIKIYQPQYAYLFTKYQSKPQQKSQKEQQKRVEEGHFLWKNQWKVNQKGQLININKKQIDVQSSVLKLVLKKMGRNILSGKSILNISLPIQIFGIDSNMQRLCKAMAYAPKFLQQASKQTNPVQRMKRVICFAIGYSILYIQMQKPFNPILGETYQCLIDGCPAYAQQISHHPPISSLLLKGRGYTAYGNFEAKVDMGMNTASGINAGFMNISFDQSSSKVIKFNCPPGELSGLVYGDRKITLTKKSYFIDQANQLLGYIAWGSVGKKNQISTKNDYFQGMIYITKLDNLKQSQFNQKICGIQGRWTGKIRFDDKVMFNIQTDAPFKVNEIQTPLKSNCHFRQDIKLRHQKKWDEAQQAKQKLQQIQRADRKLRDKYKQNH